MKVVVCRARAIILGIGPIQMMVVNKRAIKNDSAMRRKGARNHIGGVGRRPAVSRWTEAALGIRLDDNSSKIRNQAVEVVKLLSPPFSNARIRRIEGSKAANHFWAAEVDRNRKLHSP